MPLRNLFGRRTGAPTLQAENAPSSTHQHDNSPYEDPSTPGFERVDTVGSKASSAMSIRSVKSIDTGSYKLSVVNDSGVYLPPSPTDQPSERGVWPRKYLNSRSSSDAHSSGSGDIEPFSISRESFDSYRRSFDICAKSQVTHDSPTRQSLDSARFPRPLRFPLADRFASPEATAEEEDFEDVGLDGEEETKQNHQKRRFFSMFDSMENGPDGAVRFLSSRKRGQSGTGSELRPVANTPRSAGIVEAQAGK